MALKAFDPQEFRRALGTFATGVTIVTARSAEGRPAGVTANSFSSVSLNPPLVLWSLAKTSLSLPVFQAANHFSIHILSSTQEPLSSRFASRSQDKFLDLEIEEGLDRTPLLSGCCVRMQCRTVHQYEGGDHVIFVGEVVDLVRTDAAPLAFHGGKYAVVARKAAAKSLVKSADTDFAEDGLGYLLWRSYFHFRAAELERDPANGYSEREMLFLVTLFYSNWRSAAALAYKSLMLTRGMDEVARTLASLEAKALVVKRTDERGRVLYGLTPSGRDLALNALAAANAVEAEFLNRIGPWDGIALKNLLKGFILETNTSFPYPLDPSEEEPD